MIIEPGRVQEGRPAGRRLPVAWPSGPARGEGPRRGRARAPKGAGPTAHFYTVVARDTVDADFAAHRQRFLAEQGYAYRIVDADDLPV